MMKFVLLLIFVGILEFSTAEENVEELALQRLHGRISRGVTIQPSGGGASVGQDVAMNVTAAQEYVDGIYKTTLRQYSDILTEVGLDGLESAIYTLLDFYLEVVAEIDSETDEEVQDLLQELANDIFVKKVGGLYTVYWENCDTIADEMTCVQCVKQCETFRVSGAM